jgi:hypothetical protein
MRHYVTGRIYQLNKKRLSSIEDEQEGRFNVLTAELEVIEVENGIATACVAALMVRHGRLLFGRHCPT